MSVTSAVFQRWSGWLKTTALKNVAASDVTFTVFQLLSGRLKSDAPKKVCASDVTLAVLHVDTSASLNLEAP
ncbi:unannotated protein [freshwater metagenome]|uniref:Unannotated protein n=1 Tax=freshwater metagenome TaxID=449393 RepID=A0A6J7G113_9ZZZZ